MRTVNLLQSYPNLNGDSFPNVGLNGDRGSSGGLDGKLNTDEEGDELVEFWRPNEEDEFWRPNEEPKEEVELTEDWRL